MKEDLMKYIPKEYKTLVESIQEGEREYDEITGKWSTNIIVEWINGEVSIFQNKTWMKKVLKEQHTTDEFTIAEEIG